MDFTLPSSPTNLYFNSTTPAPTNSTTTPYLTDFTTGGILKATAVGVLIIIATVGNLLVCISFTTFQNLRSLTNYFIVSLSIADLLIATCIMPIWFAVQLHQPQPWPTLRNNQTLRRIWHAMDLLFCLGSILSLTAISVERNLAITNPFCYTKWLSPSRVLVTIACLWLYALTVATITTVNPFGNKSNLSIFIITTSYFLPLLILFTMYTQIFIVARRQARRLRQDGALATDLKAIKTIAIVIGAFILCYTPFLVVVIWVHFRISEVALYTVSIVKWLTYFNSCLNPIIYSCFNKTYRKSFKRMFQEWGRRLQECRLKQGVNKASTSQTTQRSRLSLNITMRSSAGSLLDGPKTATDVILFDGQSRSSLHSTRISHVSVSSTDPKGQKTISKTCDSLKIKLADEHTRQEMETSN